MVVVATTAAACWCCCAGRRTVSLDAWCRGPGYRWPQQLPATWYPGSSSSYSQSGRISFCRIYFKYVCYCTIYTAYIQLHTVNGNQYVKVFRLSNSRCKKIKIFPFWRPRMRRSNIFKCFMQKCLWKNCRVISFIAFLLYSTVDYFRTEEKSFSIKHTVQHWPVGRISLLCQTVN